MLDVPLEVPLRALALGRLLERHDARPARIEVLHEPLDGAALAGRVASLEDDHQLLLRSLHPVLQLEQLDLQQALVPVVHLARQPFAVRVTLAPGVDRRTVGPQQHRVVVLLVENPKTKLLNQIKATHAPRVSAFGDTQVNG